MRHEVRYTRWHWPENRAWIPFGTVLMSECPVGVWFDSPSAALDEWEAYLRRVIVDGSVEPVFLRFFVRLPEVSDYRVAYGADGEPRCRPDQIEMQNELMGPITWVRSPAGVGIIAPVRHRAVARIPRGIRAADARDELLPLTEWSGTVERGYAMIPSEDEFREVWGTPPMVILRSDVERLRDQAREERWVQGKIAVEALLGSGEGS